MNERQELCAYKMIVEQLVTWLNEGATLRRARESEPVVLCPEKISGLQVDGGVIGLSLHVVDGKAQERTEV